MSALPEPTRLGELEAVIERGLETFVDVGLALLEIRESRLYLQRCESFETYCRDRWSIGRSRAYQMIDAAQVMSTMVDTDRRAPTTERVARELVPVLRAAPDEVEEVWDAVVEEHGPEPTAAQTRAVVKRRLPGPKTAFKQAQETGKAVLDSTGHYQTGRDAAADARAGSAGSFQGAFEEVTRLGVEPAEMAALMPWYMEERAVGYATRLRDFCAAFLDAHEARRTTA